CCLLLYRLLLGLLGAVGGDPGGAPLVAVEHQVGGLDRADDLRRARVHDGAGQPVADGDRQERGGDRVPVRHAEAHVRGPQRHVHPELALDQGNRLERPGRVQGVRADRHGQRVDDDVLDSDLVLLGGDVDELADQLEPPGRLLGDLLLVVRQADHGGPVLLDQGQDRVQPLVLGGYRVDQRLALVGGQPGVEHLDDGGVDDQGQVGQFLDQRDGLRHQGGLVGERRAHVHVEQHGPAGDLLLDVDLHPGQVAVAQLQLEDLPAGRVDPLADDRERLVVTDPHRLGRRGQDGVHWLVPSGVSWLPQAPCWSDASLVRSCAGQTLTVARRCASSSLARTTAADASAAYPSAPTTSAYSWVTGAPPTMTMT